MRFKLQPAFLSVILFFFFSCSNKETTTETSVTTAKDSVKTTQRDPANFVSDCKQLLKEAWYMDSILMRQDEVVTKSANAAIKAFTDYAYYCASDSLSPVFLIKSAQVARVIGNYQQAKVVLDRCIENYPKFENRPAAIFLLAQLHEDKSYLNNLHEARSLYQKIIDEYPGSEWAKNAEGAIRFLGKSDEEIINEIKKNS